jgi:hypothetical protein
MVMSDSGILLLALFSFIGGVLNILFAKEFVELTSFLGFRNVKLVHIAGWIAIGLALILVLLHFTLDL